MCQALGALQVLHLGTCYSLRGHPGQRSTLIAARTWQIARRPVFKQLQPFLGAIIAGKTTWSGLWHAPVSAPRFSPATCDGKPKFQERRIITSASLRMVKRCRPQRTSGRNDTMKVDYAMRTRAFFRHRNSRMLSTDPC